MIEKIKLIFSNVQFRNVFYLFCGFLTCGILVLVFNPNLEYRSFPAIKDEEDVISLNKGKSIDDILDEYKDISTYYYSVSYGEYNITGYAIADTFNSATVIDEIEELLSFLTPSKIYSMVKNGNFLGNKDNVYTYNVNFMEKNYQMNFLIENQKIKEFTLKMDNELKLVYGGN